MASQVIFYDFRKCLLLFIANIFVDFKSALKYIWKPKMVILKTYSILIFACVTAGTTIVCATIQKNNESPKVLLLGHSDAIYCMAIDSLGKKMISGSADGTIRFWDLNAQKNTKTIDGKQGPVVSVAILPGGDFLVVCYLRNYRGEENE
jgi:WD40 repeat protein